MNRLRLEKDKRIKVNIIKDARTFLDQKRR